MASPAMISSRAWLRHKRVIGVFNGKGGVGKTTLAALLAYLLWQAGLRVLYLDFNTQGNGSRREFNLFEAGTEVWESDGEEHSVLDDDGQALVRATINGEKLVPVEVPGHPGLFIGHGGMKISQLLKYIGAINDDEKAELINAMLRASHEDYDAIVLDSPPENPDTQRALLSAVRYAVFPAKTDAASLADGLRLLGREFDLVQERYNPHLELLGGMLFATQLKAPGVDKAGRKMGAPWLELLNKMAFLLGGEELACPVHMPYKETVAIKTRDYRRNVVALEALGVEEGWPKSEMEPIIAVSAAWTEATRFFLQRIADLQAAASVPAQGGAPAGAVTA